VLPSLASLDPLTLTNPPHSRAAVTIACSKESVKFSVGGDIGSGNVVMRHNATVDKEEDATIIELEEPVTLVSLFGSHPSSHRRHICAMLPVVVGVCVCVCVFVAFEWKDAMHRARCRTSLVSHHTLCRHHRLYPRKQQTNPHTLAQRP